MQAMPVLPQSELYPQTAAPRPALRGVSTASLKGHSAASRKLRSKGSPVEFHTVKHIDNSRLVRQVEPVKLKNLYKTAGLGTILAIFCMFYIYQHFRCIDLSFQLEDLKARQASAAAYNGQLKLEIATLRDPRRIDVIARHQLGLTQASPAQVVDYTGNTGSEVAARNVRPNRNPYF